MKGGGLNFHQSHFQDVVRPDNNIFGPIQQDNDRGVPAKEEYPDQRRNVSRDESQH